MRTIKITTKREAMRLSLNTLFTGPKTATTICKYDSGKYKWTGSAKDYVGREVSVHDDVVAVWMEQRKDKDGYYAQSMCLTF